MKTIFLISIIFQIKILNASIISCEKLFNQFSEHIDCYKEGMCPDNIYNLIKKFKAIYKKDKSWKNSKVLYIYSRWSGKNNQVLNATKFSPKKTRHKDSKHWSFHVVLLHKNKIYDFDHSSEFITIPIIYYFKSMFGANWKGRNKKIIYNENIHQVSIEKELGLDLPTPDPDSKLQLHIKEIPAEIYLNEYSFDRSSNPKPGIKNWAYWIKENNLYPDRPLEEYLKKF